MAIAALTEEHIRELEAEARNRGIRPIRGADGREYYMIAPPTGWAGATPAIQACGDETGHARVEGTHSCRCGHRWFKYVSDAEQAAANEQAVVELAEVLEKHGLLKGERQ